MPTHNKHTLTRREFMRNCTVCTAGIAAISTMGVSSLFADNPIAQKLKTRIKVIFGYPDPAYPNWPNIGYDFKGHNEMILQKLVKACPEIEFIPVETSSGKEEDALTILKADSNIDGYVVYLSGCLWGNMTETVAASGIPTIIVDHLFAGSGEFLTSYAKAKRVGNKVIGVSSSDFKDIVDAVKCIDCLKKLKQSNVLVVGGEPDLQIEKTYGTKVHKIDFSEINEFYKKMSAKDIKECTDNWIKNAEKVVEPSREEIEKSAAIYLSMRNLMKKYDARAITVNCLGGVYSGQMVPAYPCLGFMQLDNDGLVGACEADQRSTMTKLLMTWLANRPGYISDPVIDTSKNQIIYAHCVASTKVFGPDGPSNPYHIRDHSEDRKGASICSLMPLGEMTTTLQFDHNRKQVIMHQGKSVENVDDDKACRTKLAVEVKGDVFKLLNYWDQWGWHRVTFYGDLKRPVYNIASLLGFEVIEEA